MDISPLCRAIALHEIFEQHDVEAGGALPLPEIEQAWLRCGLRQADLADAIAEARLTGEFITDAREPKVILTPVGYERAQRDLSTLRDIEELIRAYARLADARTRARCGPAYGRRANDRLNA